MIWHASGVAAASDENERSWIDRALGLFSTALPFALAVARAASAGQWRDDLPAVRDLGLVAVGVGGGLSTLVAQTLSLIPLGSRTFRAALGSAIALALASHLLYGLARRVLVRAGSGARLAAVLSAVATLTAALSPSWQREATVGGGATLAAAAALGALSLAITCLSPDKDAPDGSAGSWIALGALIGAAFAEAPMAGVAALSATAILVLQRVVLGSRFVLARAARAADRSSKTPGASPPPTPPRGDLRTLGRSLPLARALSLALVSGVIVAALLLVPVALRPLAPRAFADIGRTLSASSLAALDVASARTTALSAWTREVSLVSLGIAAAGAVIALLRARAREIFLPLLALLALDTLLPARAAGVLSSDPLASFRCLAVASIAIGSAVGVSSIVGFLLRARVPMAKSGAVLAVIFHVTLVALTSEEAGFVADRSEQLAAEVWADEALGRLEPRAAILVRSPAVAWRLWAARVTRGERPDVVVIPVPLLNRGRVASSLLAEGRAIEPLIRSFALTGDPSELALSTLADARPLHVEHDRRWPLRLVSHLAVDGLWLEYAPQPLGPSDRKATSAAQAAAVKRTLAAIAAPSLPDVSTASVLADAMEGQASALTTLGEYEAAQALFDQASALSSRRPGASGPSLRYAIGGVRRALALRQAERNERAERAERAEKAERAERAARAERASRPR